MKPTSKKIVVTAFIIAAIGLLTLVGVLVAVRVSVRTSATLSVDELAEMKALVYKYLNERDRFLVSSDPENNPQIADAPIIEPSEMAPGLAARQAEDVGKLKARGTTGTFDDFAIFAEALGVRKQGDAFVLDIKDETFYHLTPTRFEANPDNQYAGEGAERYFTFKREGNKWILADAKLASAGTMPPFNEPSVKSREVGGSRVLENPKMSHATDDVPIDLSKLDEAATRNIADKWVVVDKKTAEAIVSGSSTSR